MVKKGFCLLLALTLALGSVTVSAVAADAEYTASLTPDVTEVQAGETVSLTVDVSPASWKGIDVTLTFDAEKLQLATQQSDLESTYTLNAGSGEICVVRIGHEAGGDDTPFTLMFTAISAGTAQASLTEVLVSDATNDVDGNAVPAVLPEAPVEIEITSAGGIVSGTAVSWNDTDDAVYVLYSGDMTDADIKAEWKADAPEFTGIVSEERGEIEKNADGKRYNQTFSFDAVEPGSYKLAIFKLGKYVPKIVELETMDGDVVFENEIKLWLYGDVNYDGKVAANDGTQIIRKVNNLPSIFDNNDDTETITDRFLAADVSEDGTIKSNDETQIVRKVNNLSSKFDTFK